MTPRQKAVFDFVRAYIDREGFPPALEEIAVGVGLASKGGVSRILDCLVRDGWMVREGHIRCFRPAAVPVPDLPGRPVQSIGELLASLSDADLLREIRRRLIDAREAA